MVGDSSDRLKLPYLFEIGGSTWRVLLALLIHRNPVGPRELARHLKMSSHSVAVYHLTKLVEYELVEKTAHGDYQISPAANLKFLDEILFVKHKVVPLTQILYAVVFTSFFFIYLLTVGYDDSIQSGFALAISMAAAVLFSLEAYRSWKLSGLLSMTP
ncbi:MAG: helix-turn-helix domain-containing protein [Candidatus Thorarchaeota archaeon]|nr:helix-turn-helix domain-containing protein [Candidatus Thorarchaeota archaeon]